MEGQPSTEAMRADAAKAKGKPKEQLAREEAERLAASSLENGGEQTATGGEFDKPIEDDEIDNLFGNN